MNSAMRTLISGVAWSTGILVITSSRAARMTSMSSGSKLGMMYLLDVAHVDSVVVFVRDDHTQESRSRQCEHLKHAAAFYVSDITDGATELPCRGHATEHQHQNAQCGLTKRRELLRVRRAPDGGGEKSMVQLARVA